MKLVTLGIGLSVGLVLAVVGSAREPVGQTMKAYVAITGNDSDVKNRQYHRITSDKALSQIWREHRAQLKASAGQVLEVPKIDFENCMVILIFQGEGLNCTGLTAHSIIEEENRIVFRYIVNSYQTFGSSTETEAHKVTAFGLFVLRRSAKPIIIEEDTQDVLGEPRVWKECVRFPATNGAETRH
jgi:hypothetical protein